ncbi:MAG: RES domain-containing protein [Elusimicrobiales bacterium]|nr:RES domain-containing protein [Elusimicrobiales bacterium]
MTAVWRVVKNARIADAFTGEGAALYGGRWNKRGTRVVYAAQTLSLSVLEQFIHTGEEGKNIEYAFFKIEMPSGIKIERFNSHKIPSNWRDTPVPEETQELGSAWVLKQSSALLCVPSVIVPVECDFLINPAHADFHKLKIGKPQPFRFDSRLWK